ncbi:MAG: Holliday junction branch migration protein RuvA [Anaerolineales bacterium]|nr:Holliday junction branch migration protein RuvA [Anaerolineales bacterium]
MIASLSGRVAQIDESGLVLELSGVGYRVSVPTPLLEEAQVGQTLFVHTHLVVRENELSLYGFATLEARQLFSLLLGVDRVGPRLALALLSRLAPAALRAAVLAGDSAMIAKVPGVGAKTAQKIVLHLADKVQPGEGDTAAWERQTSDSDLLAALTGLGYSVVEAQTALQSLPEDAPDDLEERLKLALRYFGR